MAQNAAKTPKIGDNIAYKAVSDTNSITNFIPIVNQVKKLTM